MLELSSTLASQASSGIQLPAVEATQSLGQELGIAEWLGPLAPVALSPFFGLATLSGIATYGPEWLQQKSGLLQSGSSLNNPYLFWTMASLALLTSLPRLTKVSKPIGLAADKLEAYSAIIILIAVRLFGTQFQPGTELDQDQTSHLALSAGLGTVSLNLVLSLLAAINILVINAVKLFFECLVWLIPIPTIDAIVEALNKAICSGWMALYCFSPWLASIGNLTLLLICLMVFGWVYRRLNLYRELIVGPVLAWLVPAFFAQKGQTFKAFLESSSNSVSRYCPVHVEIQEGPQFLVSGRRLFIPFQSRFELSGIEEPQSSRLISQSLTLKDSEGQTCVIVFRNWVSSDRLYQRHSEFLANPVTTSQTAI